MAEAEAASNPLARYVIETIQYARTMERLLGAAASLKFVVDSLASIGEINESVMPELYATNESIREAAESLARAARFIESRQEAATNALVALNDRGGTDE